MKVYLDNAATTPIDEEVYETMLPVFKNHFGNPSSVHSFGRASRAIIEKARKQVAQLINAAPSELFFTAGGTEADNMVLRMASKDLNVNHIITSEVEHHAVLDTAKIVAANNQLTLSFVKLDDKGYVDYNHLQELLAAHKDKTTLISLMHANNEIGNLLDLKKVSDLAQQYNAYFHSDTVQTMGHYKFDMQQQKIDFITCSAHKFHGPKGIGFLYVNNRLKISPMITGGSQERNMRAGTENIYGIVGLAKAMEVAYRDLEAHKNHILSLKKYMIEQLENNIPGIDFNGDPKGDSLYTVLNVRFPDSELNEVLIYKFDIEGIAVSGGSACSSGSNVGSHVLNALGVDNNRPSIRFSFSKYTTKEEIDYTINVIKQFFNP
ncbi:MAG: cysteine desulfurase family protein [Vicingaceae bacterium]